MTIQDDVNAIVDRVQTAIGSIGDALVAVRARLEEATPPDLSGLSDVATKLEDLVAEIQALVPAEPPA